MARSVDNAQAVPQPPQRQEALQEAAFQTARRVTSLVATLFVALASFATLPFEVALITTLLSSVVVYNLTRLFPENSRFVTVFHRTVVVEPHSAPLLWHQRAIRFFAPVYYYRDPSPPRHQVGRAIPSAPAAFRPVPSRQSPPPLRQVVPNPRGPIVEQPHPSIAASARAAVPPPQARQPHDPVGPNAASATQMPSSIPAVPPLRISLPPAPSAPPPPVADPLPPSAFFPAVAPPQPQERHLVGAGSDSLATLPSRSASAHMHSSSARPNLSPLPRPPTPRPSLRKPAEPHHAVGERTTPPARNISSHRPPQPSYASAAARTTPEIGTRLPSATRPTREGREAVGTRKRK